MTKEKNLLRRKYMMLSRDRTARIKNNEVGEHEGIIDVCHAELRVKKGGFECEPNGFQMWPRDKKLGRSRTSRRGTEGTCEEVLNWYWYSTEVPLPQYGGTSVLRSTVQRQLGWMYDMFGWTVTMAYAEVIFQVWKDGSFET